MTLRSEAIVVAKYSFMRVLPEVFVSSERQGGPVRTWGDSDSSVRVYVLCKRQWHPTTYTCLRIHQFEP